MADIKETTKEDNYVNISLAEGQYLSHPPPGEEIVISGMSGMFPETRNTQEFMNNLFNKVNMVTPGHRWEIDHPEVPMCTGTLPEINRFDAGFFGMHYEQANFSDSLQRMSLERAVEAIYDAGMHPSDLKDSKTGVFFGACFSEVEKNLFLDSPHPNAIVGVARPMIANKISSFLKLNGPSYITDTACSSSLYAFEQAFRAIRSGVVDAAIVGGISLCCHPFVSLQFVRLGVLSPDGSCKVFDQSGDGYARSESSNVIILQKAKDAKRCYANVIHVKTNSDGFKESGITFPSSADQKRLLNDFYQECGVDPASLSFVEAHGTGTFVGDPEECSALDHVFTKNRSGPLYIGSVKSSIGHSEAGSGISSIIKSVIGLHSGFLPPNINFSVPRKEIIGLIEGRLKVVTDKVPLPEGKGLIGVNSFGFGGSNCHVLLKRCEKLKPKSYSDSLPRLVCVSGRTEEAVLTLLDELKTNKFDPEHISLMYEIFRKNIPTHIYRGYTIISEAGEICRLVNFYPESRTPLYLVFGEITNWFDIGNELMALPPFLESLHRIQRCLPGKELDVVAAFSGKSGDGDHLQRHVLCGVIVGIALADLLRITDVKPFSRFGHSYGELVAAYLDGVLDLRETVSCALAFNDTLNSVKVIIEQRKQQTPKEEAIRSSGDELSEIKSRFLQNLSAIIKKPKVWHRNKKEKHASAEYFYKSLLKSYTSINLNAVAPNSLVLKIGNVPLNEENDEVKFVSLFPQDKKNHLENFLKYMGNLYCNGYNSQLAKLYPEVSFPVSNGTEMISPYIKWDHRREYYVCKYNREAVYQAKSGARLVKIFLTDKQWSYLNGHIIDGRNLFPAMGYLYLVWEAMAIMKEQSINKMNIVFEDCKFVRATTVPVRGSIQFSITLHDTGNFEVVENNFPVVTGKLYQIENDNDPRLKDMGPITGTTKDLAMNTKDVYKELRLRGYNYSKGFRRVQQSNIEATEGYIRWDNNMVTFMDNMLQMLILQNDTRLLYVPIYIKKLTVAGKLHMKYLEEFKGQENIDIPIKCSPFGDVISSGCIKLTGLLASSIARRKDLGIPVLEKYVFVPNSVELSLEESVRVNAQIILENALAYKFKAAEVVDSFARDDGDEELLIAPTLKRALEDQPLIGLYMTILSDRQLEAAFPVEQRRLTAEEDCVLLIVSRLSERPEFVKEALDAIQENGFILSREAAGYKSPESQSKFTVVTEHRTPTETLILMRKTKHLPEPQFIRVNDDADQFAWIRDVQENIKGKNKQNVVLVSEGEPTSGLLGFVNCLRREPESPYFRCLFSPEAKLGETMRDKQLAKNLAVNVYKDGTWGTYRHLPINRTLVKLSEHCYAQSTIRGDLSSMKWLEGPLSRDMKPVPEKALVSIHYCTINFRDVMTASGRINVDVVTTKRLEQEAVQGFEFSGYDEDGNRVATILISRGMASLTLVDKFMLIDIPDDMTLREGASLPVVYGTVVYGVLMRGRLKRGESILIHSGTGGVGQAAIRIALSLDCTVFATVGTKEKKEFLMNMFPQIKESHIGNSRDTSFEQMVHRETNGRGVDVVLNSLAEEKLTASIRCLARRGRFLEIGKFDLGNNNDINLLLLSKRASFHGIMVDKIWEGTPVVKKHMVNLIKENLRKKVIRPLNTTLFKYDELEQAFRYMTTGKHTGKVVIEVRPEEGGADWKTSPEPSLFKCHARYVCNEEKTYVIIGGLGGFGLELADWLILRGARKLVLTSRRGIVTGYQKYRTRIWASYGVRLEVSNADIRTVEGCERLLRDAERLGPVDAIFNLAVVLADAVFENQTAEKFVTSFEPKAFATRHLDEASRRLCPSLRSFVIFSSVSCGKGNAGQTNYGMANSVMERICEKRKKDGFPATAIQWGAIGEVGLVAEMQEEHVELEIGGTLQQKISSCLNVLDTLLQQTEATIVSSMVVAEKRSGADSADNIVDAALNILGIDDIKSISPHTTFAELGMDSMVAVEIKQVLEREYEVFLTPKEIRTLTLAKLREIQEKQCGGTSPPVEGGKDPMAFGMEMLFGKKGNQSNTTEFLTKLVSKPGEEKVLLFPGIEGLSFALVPLAEKLQAEVYCLQYPDKYSLDRIQDVVSEIMPLVLKVVSKSEPFKLIAHSYGCLLALEVAHILEQSGYEGSVFLVEATPDLLKALAYALKAHYKVDWETSLACFLLSLYLPSEDVYKLQESIKKCSTWDERVELGMGLIHRHDADYQRNAVNGFYEKLKLTLSYEPSFKKLRSPLKLVKASTMDFLGLSDDYGLSKYAEQQVEIETVEGDHQTVLENETLAVIVNDWISRRD